MIMGNEVRATVRMPRWLHDHVSSVARKQRRSINAEIIFRLEALAGEQIPVQAPASARETSVLTHAHSQHQG